MAKIQRDQVIEAALALLDEVGLEALTTRTGISKTKPICWKKWLQLF